MFRFSPTFAILNVVLLATAFVRIYRVQSQVREAQIELLGLVDDLEKSAQASSKLLENLLLDRMKDFPEQKLGNVYDPLVESVYMASDMKIKAKVKEYVTPERKLKWVKLARSTHNLEMQAMLQEYGLKYDASPLPKEVRQWYTYVSSHVETLNTLWPTDSMLITYIRNHILVAPAPDHFPYFLDKLGKQHDPLGIAAEMLSLKNNIGTFVECGALDGEVHTTSLTLERDYGWSGMLIEADPFNFQIMLSRNRKSVMAPVCLSTTWTPQMRKIKVNKFNWDLRETGVNDSGAESIDTRVDVHCLPLTALLLAAQLNVVDLLSLNLKGLEFEVLRQIILLHQIDVYAFLVKLPQGSETQETMVYFMADNGYKVHYSDKKWSKEYIMFVRRTKKLIKKH